MYTPVRFFTNEFMKNVGNTVKEVSSFIYPPVTIYQDGQDLVVEAEIAGFSKKDIKVTVDNNVLTISAIRERKYERLYMDQRTDNVFKVVKLPIDVDSEEMSARYSDGILSVRMKTKNVHSVEVE
ncbi:MAG: archaeal heat shock protein Hsp14 [Thermoplasmata archaeon]